jgi:hypothetical protein
MNNNIQALELEIKTCQAKVRSLKSRINRLISKQPFPNNVRKGRFTIRRWENEFPGFLINPMGK